MKTKVRLLFSWSDWLIGIDWTDRDLREILEGWMFHVRLGPLVLQVRRINEEDGP